MNLYVKRALRNSSWFFIPYGVVALNVYLLSIFSSFYVQKKIFGVTGDMGGVTLWWGLKEPVLFSFPAIGFFFGSLALFIFLQRSGNRLISVLLSNIIVIITCFVTYKVLNSIEPRAFAEAGAAAAFIISLIASFLFFVRSITVKYDFAEKENRFLRSGLVAFIIIILALYFYLIYFT